MDKRAAIQFKGGETEALKRLNYYLFESKLLLKYKETRNGLIGGDYSSKLSPWLSTGSISTRYIYHEIKKFEEATPREVIRKNLYLSKLKDEGVKKQREYLKIALAKGEEVGAQEIFLRQDNLTLEAIINLSTTKKSIWLESLSRLAIDRIQERNRLVKFTGEQLTGREIEVLRYLVSENSITEIGQILHISKNTMKTHLRNIYKKLGVSGRGEAAKKAKENFII